MSTYLEVTKEMRNLGYDYKGVRFINSDNELLTYFEGNQKVAKVYVQHSSPLSMRFFQSHDLWQKEEVLFNHETVFVPIK